METLNAILESVALIIWIAVAIYTLIHFRRQDKRMDKALSDLEDSLKDERGDQPPC